MSSNRPAYYIYRHFIILNTPSAGIRQLYEIHIRHLGEIESNREQCSSLLLLCQHLRQF